MGLRLCPVTKRLMRSIITTIHFFRARPGTIHYPLFFITRKQARSRGHGEPWTSRNPQARGRAVEQIEGWRLRGGVGSEPGGRNNDSPGRSAAESWVDWLYEFQAPSGAAQILLVSPAESRLRIRIIGLPRVPPSASPWANCNSAPTALGRARYILSRETEDYFRRRY